MATISSHTFLAFSPCLCYSTKYRCVHQNCSKKSNFSWSNASIWASAWRIHPWSQGTPKRRENGELGCGAWVFAWCCWWHITQVHSQGQSEGLLSRPPFWNPNSKFLSRVRRVLITGTPYSCCMRWPRASSVSVLTVFWLTFIQHTELPRGAERHAVVTVPYSRFIPKQD